MIFKEIWCIYRTIGKSPIIVGKSSKVVTRFVSDFFSYSTGSVGLGLKITYTYFSIVFIINLLTINPN